LGNLFNHFVPNKQNADSHTVCKAGSTLTPTVINTVSSKLTQSALQNSTFSN